MTANDDGEYENEYKSDSGVKSESEVGEKALKIVNHYGILRRR